MLAEELPSPRMGQRSANTGWYLQLSRIQLNVRFSAEGTPCPSPNLIELSRSCQDQDAAQSPTSRWTETRLAFVREGLVCRMHNIDHWEFAQSRDPYVGDIPGLVHLLMRRRLRGLRQLQGAAPR